jgi:hypothetical protein
LLPIAADRRRRYKHALRAHLRRGLVCRGISRSAGTLLVTGKKRASLWLIRFVETCR